MSKKIALIHDKPGYRAFCESDCFDDSAVVVTPDIFLAHDLDRSGQTVVETWDYIKGPDIDEAQRLAQELSKSWWRNNFSGLQHQGVDICDAIQRDMWFFFVEAILAKKILGRIFEKIFPTEIYIFDEKPEPKFWEGTGDKPHIFNAVAIFLSKKLNFECNVFSSNLPSEEHKQNKAIPEKPDNLPKWLYDLRKSSDKKNLILYFAEVDYRKHAEFLAALDRSKKFNCHLLRNTNYNAPEFENKGMIWGNVIDWCTIPDKLEAEIEERSHAFHTKAHSLATNFDHIFSNPHMDFQFNGVVENIKRAARIASAANLLMNAIRPSLSISGIDTFGQGFIWNRVAKNHGVPTLAFPHGSVGSRFYTYERFHSEADHIALEGNYAKKIFTGLGRKPEKVDVVGSMVQAKPKAGPIGKGKKPKILLMTTIAAPHLATPTGSASALRRQWPEIVKGIEARPGLTFEIKPHPRYDYYDLYKDIIANGPENLKISGHDNLEQALGDASVGILVGPPSTAALVAMLAGVPAIHLNGSAYEAKGLETCLDQSGIIQVPTPEEAFQALDNLLNDKAFASEHLERVAKFLPQMTRPGTPKQVTARCMALAERLAAKPGRGYDASTLKQVKRIWTLRHCLDAGDREGVTRELKRIGKEHPEAGQSIFCRNALASLGGRPY